MRLNWVISCILASLMLAVGAVAGSADSPSSACIPASEVVSQIRSGMPVFYENVTICGELNLTGLGLIENGPKSVRNYLVIKNATIEDANFDLTDFEKGADFEGTAWGNASFRQTTFLDFADFDGATFGQARFISASFRSWAHFGGSHFQGDASFYDSEFLDSASFSGALFSDHANFDYVKFSSDAFFTNATFQADASFDGAGFLGLSSFRSARFAEIASFMQSEFMQGGPFQETTFAGQAHFNRARFHAPTTLSGAVFSERADFALASFDDWLYLHESSLKNASFYSARFEGPVTFRDSIFADELVLMGSRLHTMTLDNVTFLPGTRIFLDDASYERLNVPWPAIKDHIEFSPAVYADLVKNYRDRQRFDDFGDCYYSYRRLSIANEPMGAMKVLDFLSWIFYGFGVKPQIPLAWSIFIVLVFGSIFSLKKSLRKFVRIESIELEPAGEGELQAHIETTLIEKPISLLDPFLFSLANFTSGWTAFLYPFTDFKTTGGHSHLAIGERILGSAFISLIIAAIIKTYLVR